jgi:hypothetical protein
MGKKSHDHPGAAETSYKEDVKYFSDVLKRRYPVLIIVFAVFIAAVIFYFLFTRDIYKTQFIISASPNETVIGEGNAQILTRELMNPEELEKEIKNYGLLYKKKRRFTEELPRQVSEKVLSNLYDLDISPIKNTDALEVFLFVYDTSAIDPIVSDLMYYLNSNKFLKENIDLERTKLSSIRDTLLNQVRQMEQIKARLISGTENQRGTGYYDVFRDIANLQGRIAEVDLRISKLKGYEVSVAPLLPLKPTGLKLWQSLIVFGFIGLITGLVTIFAAERFSR